MPRGLRRLQQTGHTHFVTFSCFRRRQKLISPQICELFLDRLEAMRLRFDMRVYGYVVMPEHVHLLVSEPQSLADAIHFLKLSFAKRARELREIDDCDPSFWEKRYHDRYMRSASDLTEKLQYLHNNPVKRGLCKEPGDWKWSSFRHYAFHEIGLVEIESEWSARLRESRNEATNPG